MKYFPCFSNFYGEGHYICLFPAHCQRCLVTLVMFGLPMCSLLSYYWEVLPDVQFASTPDWMPCCQHKGVWYHRQLDIGYSCIITLLISVIWLITFLTAIWGLFYYQLHGKQLQLCYVIMSTLHWKPNASDSHQLFHTYCLLLLYFLRNLQISCVNHEIFHV